jgi:hypothetical protein
MVLIVCRFHGNHIRENHKMVTINGGGMHASAVIILPIFVRKYDSTTAYSVNLFLAAVKLNIGEPAQAYVLRPGFS